jgi:hypothetical protein
LSQFVGSDTERFDGLIPTGIRLGEHGEAFPSCFSLGGKAVVPFRARRSFGEHGSSAPQIFVLIVQKVLTPRDAQDGSGSGRSTIRKDSGHRVNQLLVALPLTTKEFRTTDRPAGIPGLAPATTKGAYQVGACTTIYSAELQLGQFC